MLALFFFFWPLTFSAQDPVLNELPTLPPLRLELFEAPIRESISTAYQKVRKNSTDGEANGRLGMILHAHRQFNSASLCYQRARILEPAEFRWFYLLGITQAELGRMDEAVESLQSALRLKPAYFPAQLKLAAVLLSAGDFENSLAAYKDLVAGHSESALVHHGLAQAHAASGNLELAEASYLKACEISPDFGAAHYSLALVYNKLGNRTNTQKHLSQYRANRDTAPVAEDPVMDAVHALQSGARFHLQQGLDYQQKGQTQKSIAAYLKALRVEPDYAQAHVNLLSAYISIKDWKRAEHHYQEAIRLNPNSAEAHYNYGIILSRRDGSSQAREAFQKALEINPFYAEAHNNLGYLESRDGNLQAAASRFRSATECKPGYREAQHNLARVLMQQNRFREVIDFLEGTLELRDQYSPRFMYMLADACAQIGQLERAVAYARRAADLADSLGQDQFADQIREELRQAEEELSSQP